MSKDEDKKKEEKKADFPKTYDKCPICESTETVMNKAIEGENVPMNANATHKNLGCFFPPIQALIPTKLGVIIKVMIYCDACDECGVVYTRLVTKEKVAATMQRMQKFDQLISGN